MPIVDLYETKGKVKKVNALRTVDEVYADVQRSFEGYI
jgi:adenylate kinase family enzyme